MNENQAVQGDPSRQHFEDRSQRSLPAGQGGRIRGAGAECERETGKKRTMSRSVWLLWSWMLDLCEGICCFTSKSVIGTTSSEGSWRRWQ